MTLMFYVTLRHDQYYILVNCVNQSSHLLERHVGPHLHDQRSPVLRSSTIGSTIGNWTISTCSQATGCPGTHGLPGDYSIPNDCIVHTLLFPPTTRSTAVAPGGGFPDAPIPWFNRSRGYEKLHTLYTASRSAHSRCASPCCDPCPDVAFFNEYIATFSTRHLTWCMLKTTKARGAREHPWLIAARWERVLTNSKHYGDGQAKRSCSYLNNSRCRNVTTSHSSKIVKSRGTNLLWRNDSN